MVVYRPLFTVVGYHSPGFLSLKSNARQENSFLPRNDPEISEEEEFNGLSFAVSYPLKSYNLHEQFTSKLDKHPTLPYKHFSQSQNT